ncbi:hypothetical protein B0H66DRAFT_221070 [Apodospora peruviana]|uniref:Uncharacterized protein n=1 Tax=Apodospora peruviana TaxID=516989 RepID=A0AAE0I3N7_9PEZI|nr:hypothetical protein B0H66DRAFT_221070 [Apodospora peruviana]
MYRVSWLCSSRIHHSIVTIIISITLVHRCLRQNAEYPGATEPSVRDLMGCGCYAAIMTYIHLHMLFGFYLRCNRIFWPEMWVSCPRESISSLMDAGGAQDGRKGRPTNNSSLCPPVASWMDPMELSIDRGMRIKVMMCVYGCVHFQDDGPCGHDDDGDDVRRKHAASPGQRKFLRK